MGELILRYGSQCGIGISELGPNCRNEIAIAFGEIGLTLKGGKGLRLPPPRSRLRSPPGMHRTQFDVQIDRDRVRAKARSKRERTPLPSLPLSKCLQPASPAT